MLWALVLAVTGAIGYGIWFWPDEPPSQIGEQGSEPTLKVRDVQNLKRRENGQLVWELSAQSITVSADHITVLAQGVRRVIYYRDGKPYLTMQARQVKVNQLVRDIEATGAVTATGANGFEVKAERVLWSHQKQELRCPVKVHATLRGATFDAPYLIYETTTGVLRCPQTARAQTPNLVVQSGGVEYQTKTGVLRCPQAVRVEASGATLSGGHAVVDTRTQRIELGGGVEIRVQPGGGVERLQNLPSLVTAG